MMFEDDAIVFSGFSTHASSNLTISLVLGIQRSKFTNKIFKIFFHPAQITRRDEATYSFYSDKIANKDSDETAYFLRYTDRSAHPSLLPQQVSNAASNDQSVKSQPEFVQ